jgi:hypothetical protein
VFTARYALSSYIKQTCFIFKGLIFCTAGSIVSDTFQPALCMSIGICADVRLNKIERSLTMHVVPTVTATCGTDIANNITYFVSPLFPALSRDAAVCSVKIQKVDPSVSQLRLDFIHFNLVCSLVAECGSTG